MVDIIVAFPKLEDAKSIKNILVKNGYNVIATALTGAKAIAQASSLDKGILICAYSFPDMIYSEIRENLDPDINMLLISSANKVLEGLSENVILLPTPLKVHALISSVDMLVEALRSKKRKKKITRQKSAKDTLSIKKAKDLLMERNNMTEEEAHRYLQKTSMNTGNSMVDTALMIISLKE